ncbi:UDP-glucose 6-dehydrogenase [Bacillus sp. SA1-12]|uniref:UDP-glucose dehydrogenase family protein n=1 Tax=Bacillus sp. SA1-12 TaxID=1455638 RepID=UPI0006272488|nr:UDP-glucose/GDP-mannose dehydrogenase family protein [Bacillus sp. SA1-12]KKI89251.1 UDP-glucose 6-dehydrogenase [Bacillus sp. SA1-12]
MKVTVAGTGYVGLVTGVCLAEIGHDVIGIDINEEKIQLLKKGKSPIYEPGLEDLLEKNVRNGSLYFTTSPKEAYAEREVIIIAVGTPENRDGSANLFYIEDVVRDIGENITDHVIVTIKSTVPVGTNHRVKRLLYQDKLPHLLVEVVSNPEFLREGSAIQDTFKGDRIVIGSASQHAGDVIEEMYKPFNIPIVRTDIKSSEMIKYASNAFLATKISFINEIANICEKLGANIEDVAKGIGLDSRIGDKFLQAGLGYGGSCFPKDTKALVQLAGNVKHDFALLESVIKVNNHQPLLLLKKAEDIVGDLYGKKAALLGLAFKPNTDDVRESASLVLAKELVKKGSIVTVYDPIALENAKKVLGDRVIYCTSIDEAILGADLTFIGTEWQEMIEYPVENYKKLMKSPRVFDGRNCYSLSEMESNEILYVSIGRKAILQQTNHVSG